MTEIERNEYNQHCDEVRYLARRGRQTGKTLFFLRSWLWRWQRIAELEAKPYNPWTPNVA